MFKMVKGIKDDHAKEEALCLPILQYCLFMPGIKL